jgi:hypothetical protein
MGACAGMLLAAACAEGEPEPDPDHGRPEAVPVAGSPSPLFPALPSWEPSAEEPEPLAKRRAAEAVLALTNHPLGATPGTVAAAAGLGESGLVAELIDPAAASRGRIVYAQFVGVLPSGASITVLVEQSRRGPDGEIEAETRSVEVRLLRDGETWRVSELAAVGGPPTERSPALAEEAVEVLDHPRIRLPSSARWDIHRGDVHPELLGVLTAVAARHEIDVLTFVTGRPSFVFGTGVPSHHARGRAVDIYAVDGVPVVEQRDVGSPAHELVQWLLEAGVREIGSPWDLDGPGGRSFTDAAHQDHIHVAAVP